VLRDPGLLAAGGHSGPGRADSDGGGRFRRGHLDPTQAASEGEFDPRRAAREAIAGTTRRLCAERGFDAVAVSQVAAAAEVSEKTVFSYVPTKEELAFAGREEGVARLVTDITEPPPGISVLDVFRALTATVLDAFVNPVDQSLLTVAKIIRHSPALQQRLTVGWESGAAGITTAVAETSNASDGDLLRDRGPVPVVHAPLGLPPRPGARPPGAMGLPRAGPLATQRQCGSRLLVLDL